MHADKYFFIEVYVSDNDIRDIDYIIRFVTTSLTEDIAKNKAKEYFKTKFTAYIHNIDVSLIGWYEYEMFKKFAIIL